MFTKMLSPRNKTRKRKFEASALITLADRVIVRQNDNVPDHSEIDANKSTSASFADVELHSNRQHGSMIVRRRQ